MKYIAKHAKKNAERKRRILEGISVYMIIQFFFAACAVDSESNIPIVLCLVSLAWLMLLVLANSGKR